MWCLNLGGAHVSGGTFIQRVPLKKKTAIVTLSAWSARQRSAAFSQAPFLLVRFM